ncbi:MAG: VWA domain-containing protein [Rubrivivax sp.]|nr:MAG: VWA domain-containing protein [Rubrivivax sp.]
MSPGLGPVGDGGLLRDAMPSLRWLVRGLCGRDLVLQTGGSSDTGAVSRPILTPSHLLLPDDLAVPEGLDPHQLGRAVVAHAVAHLTFSVPSAPSAGLKPMTVALISALEDARVERLLLREHPGMRDWFLAPLRRAAQPEGVGFAALVSRLDLALMDASCRDEHPWIDKARTLFEAQAADLNDSSAFRPIALKLAHDLGQMRVAFRPGQYQVPAPYRDDNSFLWQHPVSPADPPPELELQVPRQRPPPAQPLDPPGDGDTLDVADEHPALSHHLYPEWDHRLSLLRQDWCTVIDQQAPWRHAPGLVAPASARPLALTRLPRLNWARRVRRQPEGDDIDLDAAVAFMVARRSQHVPDARCFIRRLAARTPASILVLLDLSESTHDRVAGGAPSFLELEKSAALMLAEAAQAQGDRLAVHGFSSNGRAQVNYDRLVDFGAPIDAAARAVLSSAPGRHSTRLGAALRHATAHLAGEGSGLKAILVLTDGAPSDIDVHTPHHLVEDARHAIHEARSAGVQVHGLVVNPQADVCSRRIFGWRRGHTVADALTLPARLFSLYRGLAA